MISEVITFGIYVESPVKVVKMIGAMGEYGVRIVELRRQTKFFSMHGNGVLRRVSLTWARKTHTIITKPIAYMRRLGIKKLKVDILMHLR